MGPFHFSASYKLLGSGEFYFEMNPGIIVDQHVSNLGDELRKGKGGRIWCFNELGENRKLKNGVVKMLSGGDGMPAKGVYNRSETLIPYQTCIVATNHMPKIGTVTRAIADRLLCIEFPVYFAEFGPDDVATPTYQRIDPDLGDHVQNNLGVVLKWLVDGAVRYYQNPRLKMSAPAPVRGFTKSYIDDNDTFLTFLKDNFDLGRNYAAYTSVILDRYHEDHSRARLSDIKLRILMEDRAFQNQNVRVDGAPQEKGYKGLRIKAIEFVDGGDITRKSFWWTEHTVREYARTLTEVLPGESSPSWLWSRRFDIHCTSVNLFIEVDGEQHFKSVSRFPGCFRERQKVDAWKMRQALQRGFSVVRLAQEDAVDDKIDWRSQLRNIISVMQTRRLKPAIWYLAKSAELYNAHKKLMS